MSEARANPKKTILGSSEVAAIVNRRKEKGALNVLAKEYGISARRVQDIWREYYGGTTLADAAGGVKKPLPAAGLPAEPSIGQRRAGKFVADAPPQMVPAVGPLKARPVRVVQPKVGPANTRTLPVVYEQEPELLEGGEPLSPQDLAILGGASLEAGNNSRDLLEAVKRLENVVVSTGKMRPQSQHTRGRSWEDSSSYEPSAIDDGSISGSEVQQSIDSEAEDSYARYASDEEQYGETHESYPAQGRGVVVPIHNVGGRRGVCSANGPRSRKMALREIPGRNRGGSEGLCRENQCGGEEAYYEQVGGGGAPREKEGARGISRRTSCGEERGGLPNAVRSSYWPVAGGRAGGPRGPSIPSDFEEPLSGGVFGAPTVLRSSARPDYGGDNEPNRSYRPPVRAKGVGGDRIPAGPRTVQAATNAYPPSDVRGAPRYPDAGAEPRSVAEKQDRAVAANPKPRPGVPVWLQSRPA